MLSCEKQGTKSNSQTEKAALLAMSYESIILVYLNLAISLNGPPIPHPTSNTFCPGFKPSCNARKCSCLLMLSLSDSPFHLHKKLDVGCWIGDKVIM